MKLILTNSESIYRLNPGDGHALTDWLSLVIAATEPEDVTGTIFHDNFVDDDKLKRLTSNGLVSALVQRFPYDERVLSDFVIENQEIEETNSSKGIFFEVSNPTLETGYATYDAMFIHENFKHPRYSSRLYINYTPPHKESVVHNFGVRRSLHRAIPSKTGYDFISYVIDTYGYGDTIQAAIAKDPDDIKLGHVEPRPLVESDLEENSLYRHAMYLAEVTGIPQPDFLAC